MGVYSRLVGGPQRGWQQGRRPTDTPPVDPPDPPGDPSLLTSSDFTYLGFFMGPGPWENTILAYSNAPFTGDPATGSLYFANGEYPTSYPYGSIYKGSYPGYYPKANFTPPALPWDASFQTVFASDSAGKRSTTLANYGDCYGATRCAGDTSEFGFPAKIRGITWDEQYDRLLVTSNVGYGSAPAPYGDPSIGAVTPGSGDAKTIGGPWRMNVYSHEVNGHIVNIPDYFAAAYCGGKRMAVTGIRRSQVSFAGMCLTAFDPPAPGTAAEDVTPSGLLDTSHYTMTGLRLLHHSLSHPQDKTAWMNGGGWYTCWGGNIYHPQYPTVDHIVPYSAASPDTPVQIPNWFEGAGFSGTGGATVPEVSNDMWTSGVWIQTPGGKEGFLCFGEVAAPVGGRGCHIWYGQYPGQPVPLTCFHGYGAMLGGGIGPTITSQATIGAIYSAADLALVAQGLVNPYDVVPAESFRAHRFANDSNFCQELAYNGNVASGQVKYFGQPWYWPSEGLLIVPTCGHVENGGIGNGQVPMFHVFGVAS